MNVVMITLCRTTVTMQKERSILFFELIIADLFYDTSI